MTTETQKRQVSDEMFLHIRALTRGLVAQVDEEDRFLVQFHQTLHKNEENIFVHSPTMGMLPIKTVIDGWSAKQAPSDKSTMNIHDALVKVLDSHSRNKPAFYLFLDPERWIQDSMAVRRVLNIIHQTHQHTGDVKCLIFVSTSRVSVPDKLRRYVEVIYENTLTDEDRANLVASFTASMKAPEPPNSHVLFHGMNSYEVESSITQAVQSSRLNSGVRDGQRRVDPAFIQKYKRQQLRKTELLQLIDTHDTDFQDVGGAQRFKEWANSMKPCWTEDGQKYGLTPPRGVLLLGVYGCGKSLSAKALAKEWNLPLIQFELGRIRASAVGQSESNLYRALQIIDNVAPCLLWVDEGDKTLAGASSSAQSDAGTTSRLLGILSTWIQESKTPVAMVMTANSISTLPPEIVNRLDERFFFDLPSETDRVDIIKILCSQVGQDTSGFNLDLLSKSAKDLVGREIEQGIKSALVKSFNANKPALDQGILDNELKSKSRIITTMNDEIMEVLEWVGFDESSQDGVRARLAADARSERFNFLIK